MKAAVWVLGPLLAVAFGVAYVRGGFPLIGQALKRGATESWALVPLLLVVFVLTGFVQELLPRELVAKWLSDEAGARGLGVAWLAGALTPGGGPIGLPLAAALLKSGAGLGVVVTYVTSMSLLSFVRIPMELGIYGTKVTVIRVLSTVILPPIAGLIAQGIGGLLMR